MIDRRDFLRVGGGVLGAAALGAIAACSPPAVPPGVFTSGVASGLHSPTEAVLWTRVELANSPSTTSIGWELADRPVLRHVCVSASAAGQPRGGRVRQGAGRFARSPTRPTGSASPVVARPRRSDGPGPCRDPADSPTSLKLAFCSCQSFASGYYGAWRDIAAQDLDAVLFLGDYIYESIAIQLLRKVRDEPTNDIDTLDEYRSKYRLYRGDPDMQAAHAAHPLVPIWDDHEIVNDYDRTDLHHRRRHGPRPRTRPGSSTCRCGRPTAPGSTANLRWGNLADLLLLDGRQYRDEHLGTSLLGLLGLSVMTERPAGRGPLAARRRPAPVAARLARRGAGRRRPLEADRQPGDDRPDPPAGPGHPRAAGARPEPADARRGCTWAPTPGTASAGSGT